MPRASSDVLPCGRLPRGPRRLSSGLIPHLLPPTHRQREHRPVLDHDQPPSGHNPTCTRSTSNCSASGRAICHPRPCECASPPHGTPLWQLRRLGLRIEGSALATNPPQTMAKALKDAATAPGAPGGVQPQILRTLYPRMAPLGMVVVWQMRSEAYKPHPQSQQIMTRGGGYLPRVHNARLLDYFTRQGPLRPRMKRPPRAEFQGSAE